MSMWSHFLYSGMRCGTLCVYKLERCVLFTAGMIMNVPEILDHETAKDIVKIQACIKARGV